MEVIKFLKMFLTFLVAVFIISVAIDTMLYWSTHSFTEVINQNIKSIWSKVIASLIITAYFTYKESKEEKQ